MDLASLAQPQIIAQDDKIKVTLEIPKKLLEKVLSSKKKQKDDIKASWEVIKSLRGSWKNIDIDPIEYERQIRAEWERDY